MPLRCQVVVTEREIATGHIPRRPLNPGFSQRASDWILEKLGAPIRSLQLCGTQNENLVMSGESDEK
ncbi:hypothetical protein F2P79_005437 [Pimephales promelas]|nr:hypothetical protein F2P79_005437 [Pimephales promelas]